MSKVFYDHLIALEELEGELSLVSFSPQEKERVHHLIEETVHYHVLTVILDHLPERHHEEFLRQFHEAPYHEGLWDFLKEKAEDIEKLLGEEIKKIEKEILTEVKSLTRSPKPRKKPEFVLQ